MAFTIKYEDSPWGFAGRDALWLNWVTEKLLTGQKHLIEGKTVLDLACADGRFSYACLALGAKSVVGVDARREKIDLGKRCFASTHVSSRMNFVEADIFDFVHKTTAREFDVVLCIGFMYHTVRQVEFFRACKAMSPATIFLDTLVAKNYFWYGRNNFGKPPALFFGSEDPNDDRNTIDADGIILVPTTSFLETMFRAIGYTPHRINYRKAGIRGCGLELLKAGQWASYFATTRA